MGGPRRTPGERVEALSEAVDVIRGQWGGGLAALRSGLTGHMGPEVSLGFMTLLHCGDAPMMQVRAVGGAVNDVAPDATAYAHRTQNFVLGAVGMSVSGLNERWDPEVGTHTNGLYLSFHTDQRPERLHEAFPGETLTRLGQLKGRYDPDNVFNRNFPIPPAAQPDGNGSSGVSNRPPSMSSTR